MEGAPAAADTATVLERRAPSGPPLHLHETWRERFPWLVAGTTGAGQERAFDLGLFGDAPVGESMERWRTLRRATGMATAIHARQVHEARVARHEDPGEGLLVLDGYDAHATRRPGLLLTVSVADCVPVSLVDPETRAIALVHSGWRGTVAGAMEAGLAELEALAGSRREDVWMHAGPAICGRCYEVGPEVHEALGLPKPATNTPVDLRAVLVRRAADAGVRPERVSVSGHCTRCGPGDFFSHRGGDRGRQMAVLGIRAG